MQCDACGTGLAPEQVVRQGTRVLCEDCLMDALSPAKACDPWAVKLAKGAAAGDGREQLQGLERDLYRLIQERGSVLKEELPALLGVRPTEVERAFAVLRHMELLRARRREDGRAEIVPFAAGEVADRE